MFETLISILEGGRVIGPPFTEIGFRLGNLVSGPLRRETRDTGLHASGAA
jgi:hypothetical protein